jgi:hypothetical protein
MSDATSKPQDRAAGTPQDHPADQDARQAIGAFFATAMQGLQANAATILKTSAGSTPLSGLSQALSNAMVAQLIARVESAVATNPGHAPATDAPPAGPSGHAASGQ